MSGGAACRWAVLALVLGALAGCATDRPAPIVDRSIGLAQREPQTPPGRYVVQRGDTLYSIAFRYGLDFKALARWNDIAPPYTIYPGQEIRFEAPSGAAPGRTEPARVAGPRIETRPLPDEASGDARPRKPAAAQDPDEPVRDEAKPVPETPEKPAGTTSKPIAGGPKWQWPASGPILSTFVAGNSSRNGIDIGGESGAPVRAAAGGEVVYSGSGLIGYGELIIVKHDNALLSAYGHNRKRLVQEGDRVQAGQQIAELGQTGAPRPMLHFEIREDGKPVDPMRHLPQR